MSNIINEQKDDVFSIKINKEVKKELEEVYAKNGLTLTDAINIFFQQSLNTGCIPFSVTMDNANVIKSKALNKLMKELNKGLESYEFYSEEDTFKILGI